MVRLFSLAVLAGLMISLNASAGDEDNKGKKKRPDGQGKRDPMALFDKLDANKDGKLSKDEFAKFGEMFGGGPGGFGGKGKGERGKGKKEQQVADKGEKGKRDGEKGQGRGKEFINMMFDKLDADKDGFISKDEFKKFGEMRPGGEGGFGKGKQGQKGKRPEGKKVEL